MPFTRSSMSEVITVERFPRLWFERDGEKATEMSSTICAGHGRGDILTEAGLLICYPDKTLGYADATLPADGLCTLCFGSIVKYLNIG